ncbi:uncharacterized protein J8A68_001956 [[Candida] subhashii]|uniref:L-asparaginase n=1 Tax=[Candida] subhashii TaxID=561895 RepID=A0A8J5UYP7_9ASCO|nr:uncharacterized protein J8A68_001956 [[Candida] subhashii]KAG7664505.1 hypothetical protein J8A68_001956 [[Candida] subhashii]
MVAPNHFENIELDPKKSDPCSFTFYHMNDILIIHLGAGNHSSDFSSQYKSLLRRSLKQDNLIEASKILEDSSLTNTGYGSSLNILGKVECDASFVINTKVENKRRIGSLSGIDSKHPISTLFDTFTFIEDIYKNDQHELSIPVSLSYPSLKGILPKQNDSINLISEKSQRIYEAYKEKVFEGRIEELKHIISDTIGLIRIVDGNTTIATSSGGNFFKLPGRIGCAAIIGAAIDSINYEDCEISCMCSGNGEQIVKSMLAHEIANKIRNIPSDEYGKCLQEIVYKHSDKFYGGFIVATTSPGKIQILYGHTTESFHFGYRVNDSTRVVLSYSERQGRFTFGEYNHRLSL